MTSPMNEESQETPRTETLRQALIEDIHAFLTDGMPVYDQYGDEVGHVKMYNSAAGYLIVGTGAFEQNELYIPFWLIRSIDPHDIFLSETKDTLTSQYAEQPAVITVVEHRQVSGPNVAETPQAREVQLVQSGYDGTPVALDSVDVSSVADRLGIGMIVYDARGARLGEITEYDGSRGLMVVEKGIFRPRSLLVPLSAIEEIHPGTFTVYLSVPRDVLVKQHGMLPDDV